MKGKNWTWSELDQLWKLQLSICFSSKIQWSVDWSETKCTEWVHWWTITQCNATELSEVEIKEKRTHNDLINARIVAALQEYQDTPENIPVQQQFSRIKCFGHGKAPSRCKFYVLCLSRKRYKRRLLSACHNSNFA